MFDQMEDCRRRLEELSGNPELGARIFVVPFGTAWLIELPRCRSWSEEEQTDGPLPHDLPVPPDLRPLVHRFHFRDGDDRVEVFLLGDRRPAFVKARSLAQVGKDLVAELRGRGLLSIDPDPEGGSWILHVARAVAEGKLPTRSPKQLWSYRTQVPPFAARYWVDDDARRRAELPQFRLLDHDQESFREAAEAAAGRHGLELTPEILIQVLDRYYTIAVPDIVRASIEAVAVLAGERSMETSDVTSYVSSPELSGVAARDSETVARAGSGAMTARGEPDATSPSGRVQIFGKDHPVVVDGSDVELSYEEYRVIAALVVAGARGQSQAELEKVVSSARGILRRLRERCPATWGELILRPGKRGGGGYRWVSR